MLGKKTDSLSTVGHSIPNCGFSKHSTLIFWKILGRHVEACRRFDCLSHGHMDFANTRCSTQGTQPFPFNKLAYLLSSFIRGPVGAPVWVTKPWIMTAADVFMRFQVYHAIQTCMGSCTQTSCRTWQQSPWKFRQDLGKKYFSTVTGISYCMLRNFILHA